MNDLSDMKTYYNFRSNLTKVPILPYLISNSFESVGLFLIFIILYLYVNDYFSSADQVRKILRKKLLALGGFRELNQRLRRLRHPAARLDRYSMRIFSSKSCVFSADFADFCLPKIAHFLEFCS